MIWHLKGMKGLQYKGSPGNCLPALAPNPGVDKQLVNPQRPAYTQADALHLYTDRGTQTPALHLPLSQQSVLATVWYPCMESSPYFLWLHSTPWFRGTLICSWPLLMDI